jgi:hypothetical protein
VLERFALFDLSRSHQAKIQGDNISLTVKNYLPTVSRGSKNRAWTIVELLAVIYIIYVPILIGSVTAKKFGIASGITAGCFSASVCITAVFLFYRNVERRQQGQLPETFRLLSGQMPYRIIGFKLASFVFMTCSMAALVALRSIPWAIIALLASFLCIAAWVSIRQKCVAAWEIAKNPQLVFWAHSREVSPQVARYYRMSNPNILTLHLRDGKRCEFIIPADSVVKFADWLKDQNQSVCWDAYYNPDSTGRGTQIIE